MIIRALSVLLCSAIFAPAAVDKNSSDIKEKAIFKGREYYDKRVERRAKEKDVKKQKKKFDECARNKDGTFNTQKYLKECQQKGL